MGPSSEPMGPSARADSGSTGPTSPPPLVPAPESPEEAPPSGELPPREYSPQAPEPYSFAPGRYMLELLGGIGGGIVVTLGGLLLPTLILSDSCEDQGTACAVVLGVAAIPLLSLGVPLGVYGTGRLLGAQGRFLPTLLGLLVGAVVGAPLGLVNPSAGGFLILGIAGGAFIGAIVGFELSQASALSSARPRAPARTGVQVMPVLGATPRGSLLGGLAVRF